MKQLKTYRNALIMTGVLGLLWLVDPSIGQNATQTTIDAIMDMLIFLPPIFIFIGLMDVWVDKDTLVQYMGEHAGWKGIGLVLLLSAVAAGPLYVAFPVAALFLRKGARISYVLFFLGAFGTMKLTVVIYEVISLGMTFTFLHISVNLVLFLLSAYIIEKFITHDQRAAMYKRVKETG
ncbi:permease [Melghirimyces algeriensis]|uniref:permease n=1 Tax=Melghirimyces algeriensis TaxID=910412 RepID=UPI001159CF20|nr:permease [Melghirimyces algeriensis]